MHAGEELKHPCGWLALLGPFCSTISGVSYVHIIMLPLLSAILFDFYAVQASRLCMPPKFDVEWWYGGVFVYWNQDRVL